MLSQGQTTDLTAYVRAHAPVPPARAAVFVGDLTEQLAALHAEGRAHGPLERGVRVEMEPARARPFLVAPAGSATPPDDVWGAGVLLAYLLGVPMAGGELPPRRPDGVPPQLWELLTACLDRDPAHRRGARPPAACRGPRPAARRRPVARARQAARRRSDRGDHRARRRTTCPGCDAGGIEPSERRCASAGRLRG